MRYTMSVVGALVAAVCYGVASVLQSVGARRAANTASLDPRLFGRLLRQGPYLAGGALDVVGFGAEIAALQFLPLFFVQAAVAASIGVTAVLATKLLHTVLRGVEVAALVAIALGVTALGVSAQPERGHHVGASHHWPLYVGVVLVAVVAVVAGRGGGGSAALGIVAGLGYSGVAIAARISVVPHPAWRLAVQPLSWALVAYGLLGTLAFGTALQRGSVTTATALTTTVDTLVPAAVGLALLGDATRPGYGQVAAAGFVLSLGGALVLAYARDPDATQPATPPVVAPGGHGA
jgi:hypothetical protein